VGGTAGKTALDRFADLNQDCQSGLTTGLIGSSNETTAQLRLDALERAMASADVLKAAAAAQGIDWTLLAAIGIAESGFRDVLERGGGKAVGVFQIDLRQNPTVTAEQAHDLAWAANWAATYLAQNQRALSRRGYAGDELINALLNSYNAGLGGVLRALRSGDTADSASTNGHYGSTAIDLSKCFIP
jgi:hypothetical protein